MTAPQVEIYDIETYPNIFTCTFIDVFTGRVIVFEISDRRNDAAALFQFIHEMAEHPESMMVGFNNKGFDYPVLHYVLNTAPQDVTAAVAYYKAQAIIDSPWGDFSHLVWESDERVRQVDLFKIHHFDNAARRTSLKVLEFNMGAENIKDLPYTPGTPLTSDQMDELITYNIHDVYETWRFYLASKDHIEFRQELSEKYDRSFMNHNDTKIGKDYFIMRLEEADVQCFTRFNGRKQPIQTPRPFINLGEAVLPQITFDHPEFNRILTWFKNQTITETKGVFDNVNCTVRDFTFDFGLGGIHGSIDNGVRKSDSESVILDLDVTSYYPNLAIANRFYPDHLGETFCDIYQDLFEQRQRSEKGSSENAMLKLALNGVYGDSNNKYSPFYDPLYTMKITINGQLLLCKLAEWLMANEAVEMIQINTDGLTIRCPRAHSSWVWQVCEHWEKFTGLNLESSEYNRMFIRDVNNYIAEYADGKVKRKGAYAHSTDLGWHQNHSSQVVAKAAEHTMLTGGSARKFIETHPIMSDFYILAKVDRKSKLMMVPEDNSGDIELERVQRYYIVKKGHGGGNLKKVMPPLPKNPERWREISINAGWEAWPCNDISEHGPPINREYYIQEAQKLIIE
jgi:hypothetical protein